MNRRNFIQIIGAAFGASCVSASASPEAKAMPSWHNKEIEGLSDILRRKALSSPYVKEGIIVLPGAPSGSECETLRFLGPIFTPKSLDSLSASFEMLTRMATDAMHADARQKLSDVATRVPTGVIVSAIHDHMPMRFCAGGAPIEPEMVIETAVGYATRINPDWLSASYEAKIGVNGKPLAGRYDIRCKTVHIDGHFGRFACQITRKITTASGVALIEIFKR